MSESGSSSSSSGECSDSTSAASSPTRAKHEKKKVNVGEKSSSVRAATTKEESVDENASKGKKRAADANAQTVSVKKPRAEESSASGSSTSATSSTGSDSSSSDCETDAESDAKEDDKQNKEKAKTPEKQKEEKEEEASAKTEKIAEVTAERPKRRSVSKSPGKERKRAPRSRSRQRKSRSRSKQRGSRRSKSLERRREERKRRHEEQAKRDEMKKSKLESAIADNDTVTVPTARITEKQVKTVDLLTSRTGGAYIPPAKLRLMQAEFTDKSSAAYQRIAWEALKKSIHGYINKVNVFNIAIITRELLNENIVRGRGLLCRSIIQAQAASPTFTHVYAALVAILNSKFPNIGELLLKRLIIQFKRAFRRNDKAVCISGSRFVAHLVNQRVAHEILALEILTLLVETPTDDSVEVAIAFLKECGMKLTEVSSKGVGAIFEMLKNILHEGKLEKRVQYMIEVAFQVRKDGFKDHQAVIDKLELVEEDDQYTHLMMLDDANDPEDGLNVFKYDDQYEQHEGIYKGLSKEILGSDSDDSDSSGSGSDDSSEEEAAAAEAGQTIIDNTETNLIALRRTIYLTINSSLDYEECAHKLMKMQLKPGQEVELCHMFLDCCAEQRTYEKFYGLLAQRFCSINKVYIEPFEKIFRDTYYTTHRLDTNRLRNVAKFFAHLLFTDAISWDVLECIKLNEDDTTSSSRIFIKILFQELAEFMGLSKLNGKLKDDVLIEALAGLFPKDNPRNTRFAINFFTSIGLGGLTDELRQFLKTGPRSVPAINAEILTNKVITVKDSSSSSSSSSSDSSDSSSTTDTSGSSTDSSSTDSEDSSSDSSEAEKSKKKQKKKRVAAKKRASKNHTKNNKKQTQQNKKKKSKSSTSKKSNEQENGESMKHKNHSKEAAPMSEGEQRRKAREERHKQRDEQTQSRDDDRNVRKNDKKRNGSEVREKRRFEPRSPSASGSESEVSRKRSSSRVVELEPPRKRRSESHSREESLRDRNRRDDMQKRRHRSRSLSANKEIVNKRKARSPSPGVERKRQDRVRSRCRSRSKERKERKRDKKRNRSVSSVKELSRDKKRNRSVSSVKELARDKKRNRSVSSVKERSRDKKRNRSVSSVKELSRDKKRSRSFSSVRKERSRKRSRSVSSIPKDRSLDKKRSRSISRVHKDRSRKEKSSRSVSSVKELKRNKKRNRSISSIRKEPTRAKKRSRSISSVRKERPRDNRRRDRSRERKRSISG